VEINVWSRSGNSKDVVVDADDGIRADTTADKLASLKPAFKKTGSTTAGGDRVDVNFGLGVPAAWGRSVTGNSSQVSDGAAAVLLMKRSLASSLGLKPLGTVKAYAVAGVPPDEMGTPKPSEPVFCVPRSG
jgi:acetyl-CoA acyltransferase 1